MTSDSTTSRVGVLAASAILALITLLAARRFGPSDLWGQTQPRTIAYTADMVSRGGEAWIVARDAQGVLATKPPLYNWCAAPSVALLGRSSEFAHRLPSVLAAVAIVAILVRCGERLGRGVGWLAALSWTAMFPTFKLAYLARPDMLLCLVMLLGWCAATALVLDARNGRRSRIRDSLLFWLAFVLAAWTKGPVAVILPLYAALAAWLVAGGPSALLRFRPLLFGLPAMAVASGWYLLCAWLEPQHLQETLIYGEVVGRVTGNGPEGGHEGPWMILFGLPVMPFYFLARFAPWSLAAILGACALGLGPRGFGAPWRRGEAPQDATATISPGEANALLWSAVLWTLCFIGLFSLSSGKRADYLAPVYAPAALVAAWWLLVDRHSPVRRHVWFASLIAAVSLGAHIAIDWRGTVLPAKTMAILSSIVDRTLDARAKSPELPLVVVAPQLPHVAVLCGDPAPSENSLAGLRDTLTTEGRAFALVGTKSTPALLADLLQSGQARELWRVEIPKDAKAAAITHDVALYRIDVSAAK